MLIEALFLGQDLDTSRKQTIVLIDVLRTSATLVSMLEGGARNVGVVSTPDEARAIRERLGSCFLCGETGGSRPSDFDFGNSPREYSGLDLKGKQLVFTSSNGAKAMARLVGEGNRVFIGSYPNADAVVRTALADAGARSADLTIVASGRNMGTRYGIDDCHCAGFLVDTLVRQLGSEARWREEPPRDDPHRLSYRLVVEDSALLALQLYHHLGNDFDRVALLSTDAQTLIGLGGAPDFPDAFRINSSNMVPEVTRSGEGYLVVNPV
ncbi:MAG TPA: 2-phosphosulfolactate phosphatase [Chloroflexota bacterium]